MPVAFASCIGTRLPNGPTCFMAPPVSQPSTLRDTTSSMTSASAISGISHRAFRIPSRGSIRMAASFLLVFDDGEFDEDNTFLLSDWFKHTPREVLSKNFGVSGSSFAHVPDPSELYIFAAPVPGPLESDKIAGAAPVSPSLSHNMLAQQPIKTRSGMVRITDISVFPASKTISAALVEVHPGGMRGVA